MVCSGRASALSKLVVAAMVSLAIPVQAGAACLRGVNLAGAEFGKGRGSYGKDYAYPSAETIAYFAGKGFNAARLPFKWERLQPRLVKTIPDRRGILVLRAMNDFPLHLENFNHE